MLKQIITILIFISAFFIGKINVHSQNDKTSNFITFYPSKTTKTNGLGISYWYNTANEKHQINGVRIGINPLGLFSPFLTIIHASDFYNSNYDYDYDYNDFDLSNINVVNGIDLSLINFEKTKINGLEINITGGFKTVVNGISIGTANKHYQFNGLEISILGNKSKKCRGIQIGLVNKCSNLKGLQIGLWNVNQTKSLPLINWVL